MDEQYSLQDDDDVDSASLSPISSSACLILSKLTLPSLTSSLLREIGDEAVWSLSTAKPGNGVEQIRDDCLDTYWQSDGGQPHLINIQFSKKASVSEVAFYLDYNLDESYTPRKMSVKIGMTFHDLEEIRLVEMNEPNGWVSIPLMREKDPMELGEDMEGEDWMAIRRPIRTFFLQICVLAMHQNGRDTHVRQVKVFGPREVRTESLIRFSTVEVTQFDTIR